MTKERQHRWFARLIMWQFVVVCLVGLNVGLLSEQWSNWSILFFACQAVLLWGAYREIRRREDSITRWITNYFRRIER